MQNKDYYSAQEAQAILNMTYSALRNQVIAGNIRKAVPPGKRQAVYLKEDVDALKHDMNDNPAFVLLTPFVLPRPFVMPREVENLLLIRFSMKAET